MTLTPHGSLAERGFHSEHPQPMPWVIVHTALLLMAKNTYSVL